VPLGRNDEAGTTFRGHHPVKIWQGKKPSKIWQDLSQLSNLTANISGWLKEFVCVQLVHWELTDWFQLSVTVACVTCMDRWSYQHAVNGINNYEPAYVEHKTLLVNFGPPTKKLQGLMLTHHKSTMLMLHTLMQLSLSHITLLQGIFQSGELSPIELMAPDSLTFGSVPNF